MSSTKAALTFAMQQLLRTSVMTTQEDICIALHKKGFTVNQATVSRLLHKLSAIKQTEGQKIVYRLRGAESTTVNATHALRDLILRIERNEVLVVIQTTPGSASLVARLLDQDNTLDILGTVAGDDTIFVTPKSIKNIEKLLKNIVALLMA